MQGYMQDAKFSRGKKEILAFASLVFVGNIDVQGISRMKNIIISLSRSLISFRLLPLLTGFMLISPVGKSRNSLPRVTQKITDSLRITCAK